MPKYVIEREIPGAGNLTPEQLKGISQTSCGVLTNMGPQIQWLHSYVTGDKIYCVYIAPNEEMIREHAKQGAWKRLGNRNQGRHRACRDERLRPGLHGQLRRPFRLRRFSVRAARNAPPILGFSRGGDQREDRNGLAL